MSKLRCIQVVNVRWFNATAWYGLHLARLLRGAGHEVLTLGLEGTQSFAKAEEWGLEPLALPLNDQGPLRLAGLYGRLGGLIRKFRPQVVNCHRGESFFLWGLLKRFSGQPFVLIRTRGDQRPPKNNPPNRFLHSQLADAVIATNSITARAFTEDLGLARDKVHTILGGVDKDVFKRDEAGRARVRAEFGLEDKDFVVGILGRFDPVKGHRTLLEAAAFLRHLSRPLKILFIGFAAGISEAQLLEQAGALGLSAGLRLTGRRPDVPALVSALDLGVLASIGSEAIARAALEIMACDVPLLSTNVGVMPDLLPIEFLLPPGDSPALSTALAQLVNDSGRYHRLRDAGRKSIQRLGQDDFLEKTLQVYQSCASAYTNKGLKV